MDSQGGGNVSFCPVSNNGNSFINGQNSLLLGKLSDAFKYTSGVTQIKYLFPRNFLYFIYFVHVFILPYTLHMKNRI